MRVVADTNVLISGILWEGNESAILKLCKTNDLANFISIEMIEELVRVISGKKFRLSKKETDNVLALVLSFSTMVLPTQKLRVIRTDPSDNRVLECAVCGKADYIVSGDRHLLGLGKYKNIQIVNAGEMLRILRKRKK